MPSSVSGWWLALATRSASRRINHKTRYQNIVCVSASGLEVPEYDARTIWTSFRELYGHSIPSNDRYLPTTHRLIYAAGNKQAAVQSDFEPPALTHRFYTASM
ncbi:hypothetical protein ACM14_02460 [Delftia sp. JD2]|nr:hypothetical protein ACM14_02460 [Delftia sp. JD2]